MASVVRYRVVTWLLIGVGLLTAGYLLVRTFSLLDKPSPGAIDVCSAVFGTACDETLSDRRSWILGIPLAGWGIVFYSALGGLLITGRVMRDRFEREAVTGALLIAVVGVLAGIGLVIMQTTSSASWCPLCLLIHLVNLLLMVSLKGLTGRTMGELARSVKAALAYMIGRETTTQRETAWKVLAFCNAALFAALVYQWVYVEMRVRTQAGNHIDPAGIVAAFEGRPRQDVPVSPEDPRLGSANAPVEMVVFSSFQCPGCRKLAAEYPRLVTQFEGGLSIVFKHYPLSTNCNPRLSTDQHPASCQAAFAAQASVRQKRFWEFHDALFSSAQEVSPEVIDRIVDELELDAERLAADTRDPAIRKAVADDIALGTELRIPGTPAVFLNGRPVRPAGPRILEILIRHELETIRTKRHRGGLEPSGHGTESRHRLKSSSFWSRNVARANLVFFRKEGRNEAIDRFLFRWIVPRRVDDVPPLVVGAACGE